MLPEFYAWKPYFSILSNKNTPKKLKQFILAKAPKNFIISLEELMINLQSFEIPLNEKLEREILSNKKFKNIIKKLENEKLSLLKKRNLLRSPTGLYFLESIFPKILSELEQTILAAQQNDEQRQIA